MSGRPILLSDLSKPQNILQLKNILLDIYNQLVYQAKVVTYASSIVIDASNTQTAVITLTGNITGITINNASAGRKLRFVFIQDSSGSHTLAGWPSSVKFAGGSFTITSTASKTSIIDLEYENSLWLETGRSLNVG